MSNTDKTALKEAPFAGELTVVTVRPIGKNTWSNMHTFPKCHYTSSVPLGRNGYKINLRPEEKEWLENSLQLKPGTLSPYSEYWEEFGVILDGKNLVLYLDKPSDYLKYVVLRADPEVANSNRDRHLFPKARYIMENTEADGEEKTKMHKLRLNAFKELAGLTLPQMKDVLRVLGYKKVGSVSATIEAEVGSIAVNDPEKFLTVVTNKNFAVVSKVLEYNDANIIRKNQGSYYFGDNKLGTTPEEVANFLVKDENRALFDLIKGRYEAEKTPRK